MAIDLGDVYPLTVETRDAAGVLANAGSATITIGLPDGTSVGPTVVSPNSTGRYEYDYPTVQAGRHTVRWVATGANASAYTDSFDVRPADPGYIVSLADAKAQLNITSSTSDEELRPFIDATTSIIERHTGKAITRRTVVERQSVSYVSELWLHSRPVLSVTSIATTDGLTTWPVTVGSVIDVNPDWGRITRVSGSYWTGNLVITYVAGMSVIPANYSMAARIIVQHLWQTQRGTVTGSPRTGGLQDSMVFRGAGFAIPNAALELLGSPGPMVA